MTKQSILIFAKGLNPEPKRIIPIIYHITEPGEIIITKFGDLFELDETGRFLFLENPKPGNGEPEYIYTQEGTGKTPNSEQLEAARRIFLGKILRYER